jgi:AraC-like DNA-binding protein
MARVFKKAGTDTLSEILQTLHLQGQVFCVCELSSPWSMRLPAGDLAHFHVLERGAAVLRLPPDPTSIPLAAGDLVVLPHGSGHVLGDGAKRTPVMLEELLARRPPRDGVLRHGGTGPRTHMICGAFRFENSADNPIVPLLPRVIHVRAGTGGAADWLAPTLALLANEARRDEQGSGVIVTRLTEIIFVQSVRAWIADQPAGAGGWLGALRDRQVAAALALLHQAPDHDWHVAELARKVGMSRSPFAARFRALVGAPPVAYLSRWRLHLATTLLRDEQLAVRAIAERVGYESEAAFSKAFKRRFGASPGTYRRKPSGPAPERLVAAR